MLNKFMMQEIIDLKLQGYTVAGIRDYYEARGIKPPSMPIIRKYYGMDVLPDDPGEKLEKPKVFDEEPFRSEIIKVLENNRDNKSLCISSVYDFLEEKFIENGDLEALPGNPQTLRNYVHYEGAPPRLIDYSYLTPSLAAWVFYQKFALAVPYYRLEKSFEELGAKINRTTMASWSVDCNDLYFRPMTEFFHRKILERMFIMMDETPIQVLKEPGKTPESKSYVWLMRTGEDGLPPIVYYQYSPTRSGDTAVDLTAGIAPGTYVMCDGFSGYNKLKDIRRCTCYAHIRRYFYEAIPKGHGNDITEPAVQGVMYCNKLFEYERKYAERGYRTETRMKRRLKDEKPVIEAFIAWADKQTVSGNGKFAKAVTYLRNRRDYLMTYLEDGRCSLSNNWSENSVRPITVGRKNWLFSTSVDGANASMGIYTIVEMASLYGLSRYKYIEYLLEHRPSMDMSDDELEHFAPWDPKVQAACAKNGK